MWADICHVCGPQPRKTSWTWQERRRSWACRPGRSTPWPAQGDIPAMRMGRAWRCARRNLMAWVANGSQADELAPARRSGRVAKRQRERCTRVWQAPQAHDAQPPCGDVPQRLDIAREVLRCTACHTGHGRGQRLWCHRVPLLPPGLPAVVHRRCADHRCPTGHSFSQA